MGVITIKVVKAVEQLTRGREEGKDVKSVVTQKQLNSGAHASLETLSNK